MTVAYNSVLIVAAEESSCKYALKIIQDIKVNNPKVKFWGVGNNEMESIGFDRVAKAEELAVMGLFEILKNQKKIRSAFKDILNKVTISPPKVALLLDYGGFNLRLAKSLKAKGIKVIYFIPPKVWVWKQNRVYKIKKFVDEVFVIHPFEVDFFNRFEVKAEYAGHPLLEEYYEFLDKKFNPVLYKQKLGLDSSTNLGLMPGSRVSEIDRHLSVLIDSAEEILKHKPNLNVTVLVAPGFEIDDFKSRLKKTYDFPIYFVKDDSWKMIQICDYLITASGTATLQVGLLKKPQVIIYIMNPISAWLAKRVVTGIKFFGLVNLILENKICSEFMQNEVNPKNLSKSILNLIQDTQLERTHMLRSYDLLESKLKGPKSSTILSKAILKYLKTDKT